MDTTSSSVTSRDGTPIGYLQLGRGPAILFFHGAMESARSHLELARELAGAYTVFLIDRRGRGASGPLNPHGGVEQDVEDVEVLLRATGASLVFGVSSGGLICLEAARRLAGIEKVAVYEPPLKKASAVAAARVRCLSELARGDVAAALVTGMLATEMGPAFLRAMPRWMLEGMTRRMMNRAPGPDDLPMALLAPTLPHDFELVEWVEDTVNQLAGVKADVLLLGGDRSPAYLRESLVRLASVLPRARRSEFKGMDHSGAGNRNWRGQPERVAEALRTFFAPASGSQLPVEPLITARGTAAR